MTKNGRGSKKWLKALLTLILASLLVPQVDAYAQLSNNISIRPDQAQRTPPSTLGTHMLKQRRQKDEPVLVTGVTSGGVAMPFQSNGWVLPSDVTSLDGFQVQVRNVAAKPIVYFELRVEIFGSGAGEADVMTLPMKFGPNEALHQSAEKTARIDSFKTMALGGSATIECVAPALEKFRAGTATGSSRAPRLALGPVLFEDRDLWFAGLMFHPDPANLNQWLLNEEYLPAGGSGMPGGASGLGRLEPALTPVAEPGIAPLMRPVSECVLPIALTSKACCVKDILGNTLGCCYFIDVTATFSGGDFKVLTVNGLCTAVVQDIFVFNKLCPHREPFQCGPQDQEPPIA